MSSSNCCFLTCIQVSQEAGWVVWYTHLFQNFPQSIMTHTVKDFGIVNKAEIDVLLELWNSVTSVVSNSLQPHKPIPTRFLCPWDFPGKNAEVGCHFLLQGIFLTQGSSLGLLHLLHCTQILSCWTNACTMPHVIRLTESNTLREWERRQSSFDRISGNLVTDS